MINKNQYDNGIRCKGMCDFGNSDKGQGFIGGGCAERGFCYQYKMKHQFGSDILYKNIIFNGVKYICKLDLYNFTLSVYNVNGDELYSTSLDTKDLVKECKNAVLKANAIAEESKVYDDFIKWDGNMDK